MTLDVASKIGNTNTSEPSRDYSCEDQLDVVQAIFGGNRLILPTDEHMTVVTAGEGQGYSSTDQSLYVANDNVNRPLLVEARWFEEPRFQGFLLTAIEGSLVVAKKSLIKRVAGSPGQEITIQDEPLSQSLGELAHLILEYQVMGGAEDMEYEEDAIDAEDDHCQEVQALADAFLGDRLAELDDREGRFIDFIDLLELSLRPNVYSLE